MLISLCELGESVKKKPPITAKSKHKDHGLTHPIHLDVERHSMEWRMKHLSQAYNDKQVGSQDTNEERNGNERQ
jgi:hypothetical protein